MKFRAHDTFYIRKGWLYKGLKNVTKDKFVFMGTNHNPMDVLGIGSNMVKSLRYWLQATGLTYEPTGTKRYQQLTDFGEIIYKEDKYMEEMGTLWLLHYKLASSKELATAWYFFFHQFNYSEFTQEEYIAKLGDFISHENEATREERVLKEEFNCILNTYLGKTRSETDRNPENNLECPLTQLKLLRVSDKKSKTYRKSMPTIESIHPLIALAIVLDNSKGEREIKIADLLSGEKNLGNTFHLDVLALTQILSKLETRKHLSVVRTAGLDVVILNKKFQEMSPKEGFLWCVNQYYQEINQ